MLNNSHNLVCEILAKNFNNKF